MSGKWSEEKPLDFRCRSARFFFFSGMCASLKHHSLQDMMSHGFTCCLVESLSTMPQLFQHVAR